MEFLFFTKQIQSICWHPTEPQNLLSGSADQTVCLVDCRDANNKNNQHRWTFDSDIERVAWNTFDSNQFLVRISRNFRSFSYEFSQASTENGYVYAMDIRQTTIPVFSLAAHSAAVTGKKNRRKQIRLESVEMFRFMFEFNCARFSNDVVIRRNCQDLGCRKWKCLVHC